MPLFVDDLTKRGRGIGVLYMHDYLIFLFYTKRGRRILRVLYMHVYVIYMHVYFSIGIRAYMKSFILHLCIYVLFVLCIH